MGWFDLCFYGDEHRRRRRISHIFNVKSTFLEAATS